MINTHSSVDLEPVLLRVSNHEKNKDYYYFIILR